VARTCHERQRDGARCGWQGRRVDCYPWSARSRHVRGEGPAPQEVIHRTRPPAQRERTAHGRDMHRFQSDSDSRKRACDPARQTPRAILECLGRCRRLAGRAEQCGAIRTNGPSRMRLASATTRPGRTTIALCGAERGLRLRRSRSMSHGDSSGSDEVACSGISAEVRCRSPGRRAAVPSTGARTAGSAVPQRTSGGLLGRHFELGTRHAAGKER